MGEDCQYLYLAAQKTVKYTDSPASLIFLCFKYFASCSKDCHISLVAAPEFPQDKTKLHAKRNCPSSVSLLVGYFPTFLIGYSWLFQYIDLKDNNL